MQRREFLAASAAALAACSSTRARAADAPPRGRQVIDLRTYHFASADKMRAFEQFLADAAVPAFNRAGVEPVGAFKLNAKENAALKLASDPLDLYVLLPHKSAEAFLTFEDRLMDDEAYQKAGMAILTGVKKDVAYTRYESSVVYAL